MDCVTGPSASSPSTDVRFNNTIKKSLCGRSRSQDTEPLAFPFFASVTRHMKNKPSKEQVHDTTGAEEHGAFKILHKGSKLHHIDPHALTLHYVTFPPLFFCINFAHVHILVVSILRCWDEELKPKGIFNFIWLHWARTTFLWPFTSPGRPSEPLDHRSSHSPEPLFHRTRIP